MNAPTFTKRYFQYNLVLWIISSGSPTKKVVFSAIYLKRSTWLLTEGSWKDLWQKIWYLLHTSLYHNAPWEGSNKRNEPFPLGAVAGHEGRADVAHRLEQAIAKLLVRRQWRDPFRNRVSNLGHSGDAVARDLPHPFGDGRGVADSRRCPSSGSSEPRNSSHVRPGNVWESTSCGWTDSENSEASFREAPSVRVSHPREAESRGRPDSCDSRSGSVAHAFDPVICYSAESPEPVCRGPRKVSHPTVGNPADAADAAPDGAKASAGGIFQVASKDPEKNWASCTRYAIQVWQTVWSLC